MVRVFAVTMAGSVICVVEVVPLALSSSREVVAAASGLTVNETTRRIRIRA